MVTLERDQPPAVPVYKSDLGLRSSFTWFAKGASQIGESARLMPATRDWREGASCGKQLLTTMRQRGIKFRRQSLSSPR
jgi:hypothetical protein